MAQIFFINLNQILILCKCICIFERKGGKKKKHERQRETVNGKTNKKGKDFGLIYQTDTAGQILLTPKVLKYIYFKLIKIKMY